MLEHLKENNRAWAARQARRRSRLLQAPARAAGAGISVDRLLRQPRAGQRDRRPRSGRALRPPQRRQPRAAAGCQLPVGAAVRRRRAQGEAHPGRWPLRLRRRERRRWTASAAGWSTIGCIRSARFFRTTAPSSTPLLISARRLDRLCELNVIRQVKNVASDVFVQEAWARGQEVSVHGWVYSLADGAGDGPRRDGESGRDALGEEVPSPTRGKAALQRNAGSSKPRSFRECRRSTPCSRRSRIVSSPTLRCWLTRSR